MVKFLPLNKNLFLSLPFSVEMFGRLLYIKMQGNAHRRLRGSCTIKDQVFNFLLFYAQKLPAPLSLETMPTPTTYICFDVTLILFKNIFLNPYTEC
jgi:hypothetical protein